MSRILLTGFAPTVKFALEESLRKTFLPKPSTDFTVPMRPEQAATLLARKGERERGERQRQRERLKTPTPALGD
jgi:hypothetical protein